MKAEQLEGLLAEVAAGRLTPHAALERLRHLPYEDLSFARVDHHRALRQGHPEVVFCDGKSADQVLAICERLEAVTGSFLGTRADEPLALKLRARFPRTVWNPVARTVFLPPATVVPPESRTGTILVVTAGTSDLPVAEEAAVVADAFGHQVERLTDVGVAGLHRLLAASEQLHRARVIIVVAGMEGALPSVVGGMVSVPVIAVPTSVGYGASFGGLAALLSMLNSCAAGVTVVNIDNGFGAAAAASPDLPVVTVHTVLSNTDPPFTWVDVVRPTRDELLSIARKYGLHPTSVEDSLDPEHLPKYERIGSTTFIIVRAIDAASAEDCSTLHEMTRKVAIFYGTDSLITIHRAEQPFLTELIERHRHPNPPEGAERRKSFLPRILIELINGAVATYQKPLEEAETAIDQFESTVFGEHEFTGLLRRIYLVKRRVTLMRRMLSHTIDVVKKLVPGSEPAAPLYQDLRENVESMHFYADELLEDVNNLLSIQLALASHRTNEVVRVLTVFSVFFLPLTFIVGVYGMNFQYMPELKERWGYPAVWLTMGIVTLMIYLWFRRRGWLRE